RQARPGGRAARSRHRSHDRHQRQLLGEPMSRNDTIATFAGRFARAALLASTLLAGCSRAVLGYSDPPTGPAEDQKLWCDGRLCRWSVQEGEARPAPTWHELDPAVA